MRTKNFLFSMILISSFLAFSSCTIVSNSDKGHIIVRNESHNPCLYITDIYVKERSDSGWHNEHYGEIKDNDSQFLDLRPGCYSVKIYTNEYDKWGKVLLQKSYEVYNPNKWIDKDDYLYVIFDGDGIFFED